MAIRITKLEQTSTEFPSQWDAEDEAGAAYYIRYEYGHLEMYRLDTTGDIDRWCVSPVFSCKFGDKWDADMTTDELREATKGKFTFEV